MGEFRANPNINNRIFLANQKHTTPIIADGLYGDALLNTQTLIFVVQQLMVPGMEHHTVNHLNILHIKKFKPILMYAECILIHPICL